MKLTSKLFTCKKCKETKPLEGFYTNSQIDKNKPYQLVCRQCYLTNRKKRESQKNQTGEIKKAYSRSTNNKYVNKVPAILTCTVDDFHVYLDAKIKNRVPSLTIKERKTQKGICQKCKKKAKPELHSAHVHGFERATIIDSVIKKYVTDEKKEMIKVDLQKVIPEILEAHKPIEKHFMFLCPDCHAKYDSGQLNI